MFRPSSPISHTIRSLVVSSPRKSRREPSGHHVGRNAHEFWFRIRLSFRVNWRAFAPSAFINQMSDEFTSSLTRAIRVPSGDQVGCRLIRSPVSFRMDPRSQTAIFASLTKTSLPGRVAGLIVTAGRGVAVGDATASGVPAPPGSRVGVGGTNS